MLKRINFNNKSLGLLLIASLICPVAVADTRNEHWYVSPLVGRILPMSDKQWSESKYTEIDADSTRNFGLILGLEQKAYRVNLTYNTASWTNADYNAVFLNYERPYALNRFFNLQKVPFLYDMQLHSGIGVGFGRFSDEVSNSTDNGLGLNLYAGLSKPINHQWHVFGQAGYEYLGLNNEFTDITGKTHDISLKGPVLLQLGIRYYIHWPKQNKPVAKAPVPVKTAAIEKVTLQPVITTKPLPMDSDDDGVNDKLDACPGTPAGVVVDARGCERDSDNDGIKDSVDRCPNTIAGVKVNAQGCAEFEGVIEGLHFKPGTAELTQSSLRVLDKVVQDFKDYPTLMIEIRGHADSIGSERSNQLLSERRSTSVFYYLIAKGVDKKRVFSRGMGELHPVASNVTETGRAKNRRVEFVVINKQKRNLDFTTYTEN